MVVIQMLLTHKRILISMASNYPGWTSYYTPTYTTYTSTTWPWSTYYAGTQTYTNIPLYSNTANTTWNTSYYTYYPYTTWFSMGPTISKDRTKCDKCSKALCQPEQELTKNDPTPLCFTCARLKVQETSAQVTIGLDGSLSLVVSPSIEQQIVGQVVDLAVETIKAEEDTKVFQVMEEACQEIAPKTTPKTKKKQPRRFAPMSRPKSKPVMKSRQQFGYSRQQF